MPVENTGRNFLGGGRMAKKKRLLIILMILFAIAAFLFFYHRLGKQGESSRLLISGNIEATLVKVSFKIPGRILKRWVDEGDRIRDRALIAKLEDRELIDQKNRAEASLETAQQRMASLLLTIEKEEKTSADEIQQAEAGLRAARDSADSATQWVQAAGSGTGQSRGRTGQG